LKDNILSIGVFGEINDKRHSKIMTTRHKHNQKPTIIRIKARGDNILSIGVFGEINGKRRFENNGKPYFSSLNAVGLTGYYHVCVLTSEILSMYPIIEDNQT
ncbi:316_t:CDS:2, partial [Rhizophagus irregularis]